MLSRKKTLIIVLLSFVCILAFATVVSAQEPIIQAILFYSPSCPHCNTVITEILPGLDQQYGSQLVIYGVNTYTNSGHELYENSVLVFNIPEERQGVPTLIVGDQVLVGSYEIAEIFPTIIEEGLQSGGIDWPAIPGLEEIMTTPASPDPDDTSATNYDITVMDRFKADLAGNIVSVIVLLGMVAAVYYSACSFLIGSRPILSSWPEWLIPLLSLIGIGVAGYLSFVEYAQVEAVCGPVGKCNTVQQSSYATLFGLIPVGFLGLLGYLSIIILWLLDLLEVDGLGQLPRLGLWIITLIGTLFSVYLTFLEPFVIGATCMWCLSSAVIMTILYLLATRKIAPATKPIDPNITNA